MNKLVLVSLLFLSSVAHSSAFNAVIPCGSMEEAQELLKQYGEKPMLQMNSSRGESNNTTILFVNPETKTYTLLEKVTDYHYCVVSSGDKLATITSN